jgi:hypothetical protein
VKSGPGCPFGRRQGGTDWARWLGLSAKQQKQAEMEEGEGEGKESPFLFLKTGFSQII